MKLIVGGFRFVDTSGCAGAYGPKVREDRQADTVDAVDQSTGHARRGHAKVVRADGAEFFTRRTDTPLYEAAEKVLKDTRASLRLDLEAITVRVGSGRAVPARYYGAFESLRVRARSATQAANSHEAVVAANAELLRQGKPALRLDWQPGLHPELRLADPEDRERAERLQRSVAEAIAVVLRAVRSQDPEQIRAALDGVGPLADACADPALRGEVEHILTLADETITGVAAANRAAAAETRARHDRSQQAARERSEAARAELRRLAEEAAKREQVLSRFELLDVGDELPEARRHDDRGKQVELHNRIGRLYEDRMEDQDTAEGRYLEALRIESKLWLEAREARARQESTRMLHLDLGLPQPKSLSEEEAIVRAAQAVAAEASHLRPIEVD